LRLIVIIPGTITASLLSMGKSKLKRQNSEITSCLANKRHAIDPESNGAEDNNEEDWEA